MAALYVYLFNSLARSLALPTSLLLSFSVRLTIAVPVYGCACECVLNVATKQTESAHSAICYCRRCCHCCCCCRCYKWFLAYFFLHFASLLALLLCIYYRCYCYYHDGVSNEWSGTRLCMRASVYLCVRCYAHSIARTFDIFLACSRCVFSAPQ